MALEGDRRVRWRELKCLRRRTCDVSGASNALVDARVGKGESPSEGVIVGAAPTTFEPDHTAGLGIAPRSAPAAPPPAWHGVRSRSSSEQITLVISTPLSPQAAVEEV